jgi:hypothetical protein
MQLARLLPIFVWLTAGSCQDAPGIRPRPSPKDYPAHRDTHDATFSAALIPAEQVRKMFAPSISRRYAVVEVAIYPHDGQSVTLTIADFALQAGGSQIIRPMSSHSITASLQKPSKPPAVPKRGPDIALYPAGEVGYERGTGPNGDRRGGVYASSGVGVGIGTQQAPNNIPTQQDADADRQALEAELYEKGLPEGTFRSAVAGYVYFPLPESRPKASKYELQYWGGPDRLQLTLTK